MTSPTAPITFKRSGSSKARYIVYAPFSTHPIGTVVRQTPSGSRWEGITRIGKGTGARTTRQEAARALAEWTWRAITAPPTLERLAIGARESRDGIQAAAALRAGKGGARKARPSKAQQRKAQGGKAQGAKR